MHPFTSYEVGRQASEERRAKALRALAWRPRPDDLGGSHLRRAQDADVIEVLFGAQCEAEDAIA
jgi:hypothetical protein